MKKDCTELVFILDKSGSMYSLTDDTIGGFNSMIEKQKQINGECLVTTVLFSNDYTTIHDRVNLQEIKPMTKDDYIAEGCTALIDCLGDTITKIENIHHYIREEDIPEKTIFVITTDGMENASHKFQSKQINDLITKEQNNGWEFIFMAANIDSFATAKSYGIKYENAYSYISNKEGTADMFEAACCYIGNYRPSRQKKNTKK